MRYQLLAVENDPKTKKSVPHGVLTGVLYMQPNTGEDVPGGIERYNVCPFSTSGCRGNCLNLSGRGRMAHAQKGRLRKALLWRDQRSLFLALIRVDLELLCIEAAERGLRPAVRLNGTSDILWEDHGLFQSYPEIQGYDYTKYPYSRRERHNPWPSNYHLTYSWSEAPEAAERAQDWLDHGHPVAVVFRGERPAQWGSQAGLRRDYPVVPGDDHDMRFGDGAVIVGLRPKGRAKRDSTGFVVDTDPASVEIGQRAVLVRTRKCKR